MSVRKEKKRKAISFLKSEIPIFEKEASREGFTHFSDWVQVCCRERVRRNKGEVLWNQPLT